MVAQSKNLIGVVTNGSLTQTISALVVPLVDYATLAIITRVGLILNLVVAVFGFFSNISNIIVYARMGFSRITNITFFALAVSDLIIVSCYIFVSITLTQVFPNVDLNYLVTALLTGCLGFTSMVTALISIERCFCIMMPIKVKTMFTRRRITVFILCVLVYELAGILTMYSVINVQWVVSPVDNSSVLGVVFTPTMVKVMPTAILATTSIPSFMTIIIILISTVFLIASLQRVARWRQAATTKTSSEGISAKDVRVVRSVIAICIIYIVCNSPNAVTFIVSTAYPPLHVTDRYLGTLMYSILVLTSLAQAINSSVNIFVYLSMSSSYRATFKNMFRSTHKKN